MKLVRPDGSTYNYTPSHEPLIPPQRTAIRNPHRLRGCSRRCGPVAHCGAAHSSRHGLGRNNRLPRISLVAWVWRGRGDGHGATWNGVGLALGAGAYQAQYGSRQRREGLWSPAAQAPTTCRRAKPHTLQDVTNAYLEQCEAIEAVDGRIILMASRALAAIARHAEDYAAVYAECACPGSAAGDPALAWADVRSGAGGLLGLICYSRSNEELPQHHPLRIRKKSTA